MGILENVSYWTQLTPHPILFFFKDPYISVFYKTDIILPLIEIMKFDWLRQILYAAVLFFLTNLIFLMCRLHVTQLSKNSTEYILSPIFFNDTSGFMKCTKYTL